MNKNFPVENPDLAPPEVEKKFLPSRINQQNQIVGLPEAVGIQDIMQFYLNPRRVLISDNQLFYRKKENFLCQLSPEETVLLKTAFAKPNPPKLRLRLIESKGQPDQALVTVKIDTRPDPLAPPTGFIRNLEFERATSFATAERLLYSVGGQTGRVIAKTRHLVRQNVTFLAHPDQIFQFHKPFEVDFFKGPNSFAIPDPKIADNAGLVMIEQELSPEEELLLSQIKLPTWIGEDVTTDNRFTNAKLSLNPFATWKDKPKVFRSKNK